MQVSKLLQYAPQARYTALEAMTHPFFDELRDPTYLLPNGEPPCCRPTSVRCVREARLATERFLCEPQKRGLPGYLCMTATTAGAESLLNLGCREAPAAAL